MAATVSSVWAKPGAWALDAEEHEEELKREIESESSAAKDAYPEPPAADFPTLAAAASAKAKKKNKGQTLSLSEFTTSYDGGKPSPAQPQRLTHDEFLSLPTAPRQRSAEELDQSRLGGGFRNYGSYGADRNSRVSDRGNSGRERVDLGPSRADEADNWSKSKKFTGGAGGGSFGGGDRRDKVGFFGGSSKADEVDNWGSGKSFTPALTTMDAGRRDRRMGFDSFANGGGGADSENWGRRKEERDSSSSDGRRSDRGFDREKKVVGLESSGETDSENWLRKKEEREVLSGGSGNGERPRLKLQPRSLPVDNLNGGNQVAPAEAKPKSSNPFGEARPREEVLKEKGKDWKEIDEKLEAAKIKSEGSKGFGTGKVDSSKDDLREKSWRKAEAETAQPASSEKTEHGAAAEIVEDISTEKEDAESTK